MRVTTQKNTHRYIIVKHVYYPMLTLEYKTVNILVKTLKNIGIDGIV